MSGVMLRRTALLSVLALGLMAVPVTAGPFDEVVDVSILPGWRTDEGEHMAGLRISLAPGWKTYWRAPGDAGIPPRFDWTGSENLTAVGVGWPVPEVFTANGMRSIGYSGEVVLPLRVMTAGAGAARLTGTIQLGICEEVCIPVTAEVDAILPGGGERDPLIVAALVDRPLSAVEAGVGAVTCTFTPNALGLTVRTRIEVSAGPRAEMAIIEAGDPAVWTSEPRMSLDGTAIVAEATMMHVDGGAFSVERSDMRITVIGGGQAVDIRGCSGG